MRLFYRCFPKRDTLRPELTWSHYRRLISVEDTKARLWYMNEAADSVWSTRQMDRQISTLYYERLLASREKESVVAEAEEKLKEVAPTQFIHDPFVLEFLERKKSSMILNYYSEMNEAGLATSCHPASFNGSFRYYHDQMSPKMSLL